MISKCCHEEMKVVGGDEGTNHYECTKCGNPCDPVMSTPRANFEAIKAKNRRENTMTTREELKAEILHDIRRSKMQELIVLQMKKRQVTRTRLQAPTQQNLAQMENDIQASIKVKEYELDLIEEEMKESK